MSKASAGASPAEARLEITDAGTQRIGWSERI